MQHCVVEIDDFILVTQIISLSCTNTQSLWYDRTIQEVEKHFVHDFGARSNMEHTGKIMKRMVGRMRQLSKEKDFTSIWFIYINL